MIVKPGRVSDDPSLSGLLSVTFWPGSIALATRLIVPLPRSACFSRQLTTTGRPLISTSFRISVAVCSADHDTSPLFHFLLS
jgi:hypothetical protein